MGLQGFLWICPPDYASSQHADRKLGGASDQKGEPDLTSCSEQVKVQNHLKWSLRKQLSVQQQNNSGVATTEANWFPLELFLI